MRAWITESKKAMIAQMGSDIPGVKETDHQVPVRDGSTITCRTYQPESPPSGGSPLVVIYHGGGWCIGGLENEELLCRLLVSKLGTTCVNVDYRLAPEHKFPAAVHDSYDATKWVSFPRWISEDEAADRILRLRKTHLLLVQTHRRGSSSGAPALVVTSLPSCLTCGEMKA